MESMMASARVAVTCSLLAFAACCGRASGAVRCDSSDGCRSMTMMSYNIRIGCGAEGPFDLRPGSLGHLPEIAEVIRTADPDWVAIQEIDCGTARAGFVDQTAELAKLCGMKGVFARKTLKTHKGKTSTPCDVSDREMQESGAYGLAILSKEEPVKVSKVLLPGRYHTRCVEFAEFDDYVVACTHFPLKEDFCIMAAKVALANIADFHKPVFLAGDLNVEPESPTIGELKKGMTVLSDMSVPTFPSGNPVKCIDYIMVNSPFAGCFNVCGRSVIRNPSATDHCAVVVKGRLRPRP